MLISDGRRMSLQRQQLFRVPSSSQLSSWQKFLRVRAPPLPHFTLISKASPSALTLPAAKEGERGAEGGGRGTHPAFSSFLFLRYCLARDWPTTLEFQGKRAEESANSQLSIFRKRRCVDSVTPFSSEPPTQCHQRCTERWWWPSPFPFLRQGPMQASSIEPRLEKKKGRNPEEVEWGTISIAVKISPWWHTTATTKHTPHFYVCCRDGLDRESEFARGRRWGGEERERQFRVSSFLISIC